MKKILLSVVCGILVSVASQSILASCTNDVASMQSQIKQWGSIHTPGCPFDHYGWGVDYVAYISETGNQCTGVCVYPGANPRSMPCVWGVNHWSNTLTCNG